VHSPTFRGDSWNRTLIINAQRMIFGVDVKHLKYLKGWHPSSLEGHSFAASAGIRIASPPDPLRVGQDIP